MYYNILEYLFYITNVSSGRKSSHLDFFDLLMKLLTSKDSYIIEIVYPIKGETYVYYSHS